MDTIEHPASRTRKPAVLPARLRARTGSVNDIHVLDLSLAGCMIERRTLPLSIDDRVLVRLADLGFMPATVVWVEDQEAGLVFEQELYEPVLQRLRGCFIKQD